MAITIGLEDGRTVTIERDTATIGQGSGVDVVVASKNIQPVHARIVRVAGRWMVESAGDWLLQVGDGVPGRKQWIEPDQVIWLTESGVMVVFEPSARLPHDDQPSVIDDTGMCLGEVGSDSSVSSLRLPPLPQSPLFPPPLPLPACYVKAVDATIEFRGGGAILIGKGTVTFTGRRYFEFGKSKPGSLVVPLSDVANVNADTKGVTVAFMLGNALARLMFDAVNADEAKDIAAALERDELSERQRKRTEASGHAIFIDPAQPQFFSVVYQSGLSDE